MYCFHRVVVSALLSTVLVVVAGPASGSETPRDAQPSLSEALENWVALLEQDDVKTPAKRWAADEQAAKALEQHWPQLKQCHQDYNYRTWIDGDPHTGRPGARRVGDATKFTVGGHEFGHLHVNWVKRDNGWRIAGVWMCR